MRECEYCRKSIVRKNAQARFCSDKCRTYARRANARIPYPKQMIDAGRWIRRSQSKVPLQINGNPASSTNSNTWSDFISANASRAGVGLGFVLGNGFACIDLDHCFDGTKPSQAAVAFLADYPNHYIEVSPSGDGLHIWGTAAATTGSRKIIDGLNVERYSSGRYITMTGRVFQKGQLFPL